MEDDFAEDTVLLCPSPLPPVKAIHVEGSRGDGKKRGNRIATHSSRMSPQYGAISQKRDKSASGIGCIS